MKMSKKSKILSGVAACVLLAAAIGCAVFFLTKGKSKPSAASDGVEVTRSYFRSHAVYNGDFRSELTEDELFFYDLFYKHYFEERSLDTIEVDVSHMHRHLSEFDIVSTALSTAEYAFTNDHPEAFWVGSLSYGWDDTEEYISKIYLTASESFEGALASVDQFQSGLASAVSEIRAARKSDSRYDTVKAIHDYICDHVSYFYSDDYAGEAQTAAPLFGIGSTDHRIVCEGYAMAFKLLCDQFEIPATVIGSRSHAFNYVQMEDGRYYFMDCTWDDNESGPIRYDYFLRGYKSILWDDWHINDDFDHIEYWYYVHAGTNCEPIVYPEVSDDSYAILDFLGENADPERPVSGTVTFQWKYKGNDYKGKTADVSIDDKHIGQFEFDDNGMLEVTCDTTKLYNGTRFLKVTVDENTFSWSLKIQNTEFEFLNWDEEVPAITEPYKVTVKGYASEKINQCSLEVILDSNKPYTTVGFNEDGITSFVIDPKRCGDGFHRFSFVMHKPGILPYYNFSQPYSERYVRVSVSPADSGELRFCGPTANRNHPVGEWIDYLLKYDGKVTDNYQFDVFIDDVPVKPFKHDAKKVTDFFDKDGFCRFYIDTNGQSNGDHILKAVLTKEDGSQVTATNFIETTDGYFKYTLWREDKVSNNFSLCTEKVPVIEGFLKMQIENTSEWPGSRCSITYYEDNDWVDSTWTECLYDEDVFFREMSTPGISYGGQFLKVVFKTPSGVTVEKCLPYIHKPSWRFYDEFDFFKYTTDQVSKVGKTAAFTLLYTTLYSDECQKLTVTLDDKPIDLPLPDKTKPIFDKFGRFYFTLDLDGLSKGRHILTAQITKKDGAVMTAKKSIELVDDKYAFTFENWKEDPTISGISEVRLKNTTEIPGKLCTVRQYIDGQDVGVATFGSDNIATLHLNTEGLAKGEHLYKVVFTGKDGLIVERYKRFRVK